MEGRKRGMMVKEGKEKKDVTRSVGKEWKEGREERKGRGERREGKGRTKDGRQREINRRYPKLLKKDK